MPPSLRVLLFLRAHTSRQSPWLVLLNICASHQLTRLLVVCLLPLSQLFGSLWGTNELLTSFDAINMLGPHNESPSGGWLHVDQVNSGWVTLHSRVLGVSQVPCAWLVKPAMTNNPAAECVLYRLPASSGRQATLHCIAMSR